MLQAAVDRFGWTVAGAGPIEVGQYDQAELIQAAERGQVSAAEGSVRHVEVLQMGGVGTSILGRPRHLPRDRRASRHPTSDYTLNCEEPD